MIHCPVKHIELDTNDVWSKATIEEWLDTVPQNYQKMVLYNDNFSDKSFGGG